MKIKLYKKLTAIKLKDGKVITTEISVENLAKMLNENDFITIGNLGFSKYEVKTFEAYEPSDIDSFIYSQPKKISEELEKIRQERKEKGFTINGTEHLREIYQNRIKKDGTQ